MKIVPSKGFLAVKLVKEQARSKVSGLTLGEEYHYEVAAVGDGVEMAVGSKVLIGGVETNSTIDGQVYHMVKAENVVAQLV